MAKLQVRPQTNVQTSEIDPPRPVVLTLRDLGLHQAAYDINQTCVIIGKSRATFYRMVERGEIAITKIGSRTAVTAHDIAELLNRHRRPASMKEAA